MIKKSILALSIAGLLTACGGGGDDPAPIANLTVTSTSWADGGTIPLAYANPLQGGSNTSPQLAVASLPTGTASLAIVMDDEISPCGTGDNACKHWNVFNLPSTKTSIAENEDLSVLAGVVIGKAYVGPNPPSTHTYKISVYALNALATTTAGTTYTRSQFETLNTGKILGKGTWTGTFTPPV